MTVRMGRLAKPRGYSRWMKFAARCVGHEVSLTRPNRHRFPRRLNRQTPIDPPNGCSSKAGRGAPKKQGAISDGAPLEEREICGETTCLCVIGQ